MEPTNRPGRPIAGALQLAEGEVTLAEALRGHAFLSGLDETQFEALGKIAQPVQFHEQELILAAKQRPLDFYLLLSGSVSIELNNRHYAVRIQSLGPGDAFGWSALLQHHDTLFDVRTRERCTALRLDGTGLSAVLREDPLFAAELLSRTLHLVAGRVLATEMRLAEFCGVRKSTTEQRVGDPTIRTLNKLIEICLDGELGYRTAAEHLHGSKPRSALKDHAIQRAQFAERLREEVERLGGNPSKSGSIAASLHRGWIALKAAVSGGDAKSIINACETGDDAACAAYEAATNSDFLPTETRLIIEAQWRAVHETRAWLREIRDHFASGVEVSGEQLGS